MSGKLLNITPWILEYATSFVYQTVLARYDKKKTTFLVCLRVMPVSSLRQENILNGNAGFKVL